MIHASKAENSSSQKKLELTEEDKKVLKIAAKSYYRNILERGMAEYVITYNERKGLWNERTSKSQLGTLDSIITAYRYNPDYALEEVRRYIKHANDKEENNRTQKTHNSLSAAGKFIEDIFSRSLEETLGKMESNTIMGISKSEILSEEEEKGMKLDLIIDLIRLKNKEDK